MPCIAAESDTQTVPSAGVSPSSAPRRSLDDQCAGARRRQARGQILLFPGVFNTRFQLWPLTQLLRQSVPLVETDVRVWGTPLRPFHNLAASARNRNLAERIADALARRRHERPDELLYVLGFSGGGGFATLVASALARSSTIDRLILIAPAISPAVGIAANVLPHVREFVAVFASARDLQVGWGTRLFGTIDRVRAPSAGAVGFAEAHPRLLQWHWSGAARRDAHYGNHLSFLAPRWQRTTLWPALDPLSHPDTIRARWAAAVASSEADDSP